MKSLTSGSVIIRLNKFGSSERSIRLLHTDRMSEDHLRDKRLSSHATNVTKKVKLYRNVYLATLFGRKFSTVFVFFALT